MQDGRKAVWSIPNVSVAFFSSLKQNFIAYRSSNVSWRPDRIFEIHQLWQSGFSRVYSNCCRSCSFEPELKRICQSSHKMYSNNIMNLQVSTTILNAWTERSGNLLNAPYTLQGWSPRGLFLWWDSYSSIWCGEVFLLFFDVIIILGHHRGYPWPSLAAPLYRSSLPAGPQGYIPYPHWAAVWRFVLVALLLLGHVRGSIGENHLWAFPYFSSCVLHVWSV